MSRTIFLALCLVGSASVAQQPATPKAPEKPTTGAPAQGEDQQLQAKIKGSYYHPDSLPGMQCTATVDWATFFKSMHIDAPPDRLKTLESLHIKLKAMRKKPPELKYVWEESGAPANFDQLETGLRQTLTGYFQTYWSLLASGDVAMMAYTAKITRQTDGGTSLETGGAETNIKMMVDPSGLPTTYQVNVGGMKVTMSPKYEISPHPVAGDLRRVVELDITQAVGTNVQQVVEKFDYQPMDTYFVPKHLTAVVGGTLTMPFEFSECKVPENAE